MVIEMSTLHKLISSEIGDFFAGLGQPGEPASPEEMQQQLIARVMPLLDAAPQSASVVVIPSIWIHYSGAKVAGIYEQAMNKAGVKWVSVDDVRAEGC